MTKGYEQRKKSNEKYLATLDEIKVRVPKGQKEAIKAHAESQGESVNGFISRAIIEVSEMDNMHRAYQRGLLRHLGKMMDAMELADFDGAKCLLAELIEDTQKDIGD